MAHKIVATVIFKTGVTTVLEYRSTENIKHIENVVDQMRRILKESYKEQTPSQLTVGTTMVNVLDTSSIDLRIKWCF